MNVKMQNDLMELYLSGSIDSSNSDQTEKEIFNYINKMHPKTLLIDAEKLTYISSAGLRIILKLRKLYNDLKIINASSDVYEIFDVTGFTEIVSVEKAYRVLDVSGCEIIGEGANGIVYRVDRDTIVKVYRDANSLDDIKREREMARTAFIMGIPTAIPFDVVKVGDTYGSVFELLDAKSFDELMIEDPSNLEFVAQESIKVAKIIHSTDAHNELSQQSDTVIEWIEMAVDFFTEAQYKKLKALIEAIPDNGKMLHGDFHIKNIMLQNNETLLIDMDTLCTGHPIYELAFMYNAYKGFGLLDRKGIESFLGISIETANALWKRSLELYLETDDPSVLESVEKKASLIGYLRIMTRVIRKGKENTDEGKKTIEACRQKLAVLIDEVDTLTF